MPELPDVTVYVESLRTRLTGSRLLRVRLLSPFLLRSVDPPIDAAAPRDLLGVERLGKRIVFALEGDLFLVVHLMIAGRLQFAPPEAKIPKRIGLLGLDFSVGTVILTEVSQKKRAALHVVSGRPALRRLHAGGIEVQDAELDAFQDALTRENHTVKRSLTDPRLFSGIGNAYSDEILHRARLSPIKLTKRLSEEEIERLYHATRAILDEWTERLRRETGTGFPTKVTAFRPEMAVHGKFDQPCPVCGAPVQRIVYAENEANYCARCQNNGKLLADRALSRLLREDWPRSLEELEEMKRELRNG